jgi:hypothetical protein
MTGAANTRKKAKLRGSCRVTLPPRIDCRQHEARTLAFSLKAARWQDEMINPTLVGFLGSNGLELTEPN